MSLLMCRACGEFVTAIPVDGGLVPDVSACTGCDGRSFTDPDAGRVVEGDD